MSTIHTIGPPNRASAWLPGAISVANSTMGNRQLSSVIRAPSANETTKHLLYASQGKVNLNGQVTGRTINRLI